MWAIHITLNSRTSIDLLEEAQSSPDIAICNPYQQGSSRNWFKSGKSTVALAIVKALTKRISYIIASLRWCDFPLLYTSSQGSTMARKKISQLTCTSLSCQWRLGLAESLYRKMEHLRQRYTFHFAASLTARNFGNSYLEVHYYFTETH